MQNNILARKSTHYLLMLLSVAALTMAPMVKRDAHAIGGVVFDPTNFYANIQQFYQTVEQVRAAYAQLRSLEAQLNAMTSQNSWSRYLTQKPEWLPASNDETQKMIEAGYNPGDQGDVNAFNQAKVKYANKYRPLKPSQVSKNVTDRNWVAYEDLTGSTQAAVAMTDALYDDQMKKHEKFIEESRGLLDTASDLKASVDLNNSMLHQSMQIQIDQLKISNQMLRMAAMESNEKLSGMAVNAEFAGRK